MPHVYGDLITLDLDLPARVLASPDCPPAVLDARRAFDDAQAAVSAARDAVDAIKDEAAENRAAIARAIRDGKKAPTPIAQEITDERIRQAEVRVRAAVGRARTAAQACEDAVPSHRAELRALMVAPLADLAARTAAAVEEARRLYGETRALISAVADLDTAATHRDPEPARRAALSALVGAHYADAARTDALHQSGRPNRIDAAWADVIAAASIPVGKYTSDPLAAPDIIEGTRLVTEAERRRAAFAMPGDEPIRVVR